MSKKHLSVNAGFFFKYELLFSPAYIELTKSARDLLHCLTMELKFSKKDNRISYPNNGSVSYTEIQFKEEFGRASNTYLTARNQLIKNGLIRLTYRGGMCRGDRATYKILITSDLHPREMRWLRYPKDNWECDIPKPKKYQVGIGTRFKAKATLINSTHNDELHP
jgi:hypothetical protein